MSGRMHRGWHGAGRGSRGPGRGGWQQADLPGADDAAAWLPAGCPTTGSRAAGGHGRPRGDPHRRRAARPLEGVRRRRPAAPTRAAEAGPDQPVPRGDPRGADRDRPPGRAPLRPQGRLGRAARRAPRSCSPRCPSPVMTRLRQPERLVLDTLVDAGVARSRSDALAWAVRLVGEHADDVARANCARPWRRSTTLRREGPGPGLTASGYRRGARARRLSSRVRGRARSRCSGRSRPAPWPRGRTRGSRTSWATGWATWWRRRPRRRCRAAPPTSSSTSAATPRVVQQVRQHEHRDPAQRDVDRHAQPARRVRPHHLQRHAGQRAAPHHGQHDRAGRSGIASTANGVYVPAMNRKIIEWSSRFISVRARVLRQVRRWYSALTPNRPSTSAP